MADAIVKGMEALQKTLKNIDKKMADKVLRFATSKGLDPIKRRAKSNAKWPSIKKLIGKKVWKNRKKNITGKVYLRPGKDGRTVRINNKEVDFSAVGSILEFGSSKRNIAPRPFMRPAREQAKGQVLKEIARAGEKKLKELVNRERKK